MNKEEIEKLFIELQFDDFLGVMLYHNIISMKQYNFYNELYYNGIECKEHFIENVIDKIK